MSLERTFCYVCVCVCVCLCTVARPVLTYPCENFIVPFPITNKPPPCCIFAFYT